MKRRQLLSTIPVLAIAACSEAGNAEQPPRNGAVVIPVGSESGTVRSTSTGIVMPPVLQPTDPNAITTFGFIPFNGVPADAQTTTFACPLPDNTLLPTDDIMVGDSPAQLDVASLYPSGYLRHALIATQLPQLAAGATRVSSLVKGGKLSGTAPVLACNLVATFTPTGGAPIVVDIGAAFRTGQPDILRMGALLTEGRLFIPVPGLDRLRMIVDLQCFSDGIKRADIQFDRGVVTVTPAPNPKAPAISYSVVLTDNGKVTYTSPVVRHDIAVRWTPTFRTGLMQPVHVQFDLAFLRQSGAIIHDGSLGVSQQTVSRFTIQPTDPIVYANPGGSWTINGIFCYMPTTGGRDDIGPQTTPVATWLISQDADVALYCLWQADGALTIPIFYTDSRTNNFPSIIDHPKLCPNQYGQDGFDVITSNGTWNVDNAHAPCSFFVPWLLTGRRSFCDGMMAWAAESVYWFGPAYRQNEKGLILQTTAAFSVQQVRGQAWEIRMLGQAATYGLDKDPFKAVCLKLFLNNLNGLSAFISSPDNTEGKLSFWLSSRAAMWEQDYFASSMAAFHAMGYPQAGAILNAQMGFLAGSMLTPDYYAKDCCAYDIVGLLVTDNKWSIAKAKEIATGRSGHGTRWDTGSYRPSYANRRSNLVYAVKRLNNPQARQALTWFMAAIGGGPPSDGATDARMQIDPTFMYS